MSRRTETQRIMGIDATIVAFVLAAIVLGYVGYMLGLKDGRADAAIVQTRQKREARDEHIAALIESMPVPIAVADAQGAVTVSSSGFSTDVLQDERIISPDILDILDGVAEDRQTRTRRFISASGTAYSVTITPVDDDLYAIVGLDVTEQVSFERMRRDFMSNVSHELKTPTGAIALMADTIGECADDPDTVRHFADRISAEALRLSGMIVKLIELTKAEKIGMDAPAAPVNVIDPINQAIDDAAMQAEDAGVEVIVRCDENTMACIAPDQLRSAVRNLVENAIHYSPRGEHVTVTAGKGNKGRVVIRVIDNGRGIPAVELPRIFERFYRVDHGRGRDTGGTGIGLAIVRQVVADAGGTIDVWSRPGAGSTFTITLPVYQQQQKENISTTKIPKL